MGYERYPRDSNQGDYYGDYYVGRDPSNYGRDYGSGRDYSYSSAREYEAAGEIGPRRDRDRYASRTYGRRDYGARDYGNTGYGDFDRNRGRYTRDAGFQDSYGSDGHRFAEPGRDGDRHDTSRRDERARYESGRGDRGPAQGYRYEDRDFFSRAGDEVRSWFGDEEAERRRELDSRHDERLGGRSNRDDDYDSWRRSQIDALDRDYHEYRQENRSKFENEFGSWRTERQTQRGSLSRVEEHMDVVGSDGEHVGTVDKVQGDRILLTKSDADAGGRHHSIPSRWIETVDSKVTIRKTAAEAKAHWRDEERSGAFFGDRKEGDRADANRTDGGAHILNRSFSGTYKS